MRKISKELKNERECDSCGDFVLEEDSIPTPFADFNTGVICRKCAEKYANYFIHSLKGVER